MCNNVPALVCNQFTLFTKDPGQQFVEDAAHHTIVSLCNVLSFEIFVKTGFGLMAPGQSEMFDI